MVTAEARAAILHEHYNRTFDNIQEHIRRRELLLVTLLLLVAVMLFEAAFPAEASEQLAAIVSKKLELARPLDISFMDSVLWFGMLCLLIRYCQAGVYVERQYRYIHGLEQLLNQYLGGEDITREGKAYLAGYPCFSNWAHHLYATAFPLLLAAVLVYRWESELEQCRGLCLKVGLDAVILVACLITLFLYIKALHLRR
jgi:hypothetical protein